MRIRGAVVIKQDGQVALIRRVRNDRTYYLFPGGGAEEGETPEQAAVREAFEELGVEVRLERLVALVEFRGSKQYFFAAIIEGGVFGTGDGPEFSAPEYADRGSYTPVWMDVTELDQHDVRPRRLCLALKDGRLPIRIREERFGRPSGRPQGRSPQFRSGS
jgi:8-oxo-dGTP diphosphatase